LVKETITPTPIAGVAARLLSTNKRRLVLPADSPTPRCANSTGLPKPADDAEKAQDV